MDLRKEIQVALNNCQPNTNRVDKIEAIAQKYAELYHALQLQQTGVIKSVCEIEKEFEKCPLFKQYDNGCYGCKYRKQTVL